MKLIYILLISFLFACSSSNPSAEEIVNKSIEYYGGKPIYNSLVQFDFRNKHYTAAYSNSNYTLTRSFSDSTGNYQDILTNSGFKRIHNGTKINLPLKQVKAYSNSINSVIYFFRIPFNLTDNAVQKKLIGKKNINGISYYKIEITFSKNGGGSDFNDRFIYWINTKNYAIDYFAYQYQTNGGGKRFREAKNRRRVNGLLVCDYINYQPKDTTVAIENFDIYFEKGGMQQLSVIENKNIKVIYSENR